MLITRNTQATNNQDVLYWDNGREKIRIPDDEQVKYFKKEINRLKQANNYQSAMDLQMIDDLKLDLDVTKAALLLTENSLNNARSHIARMSK